MLAALDELIVLSCEKRRAKSEKIGKHLTLVSYKDMSNWSVSSLLSNTVTEINAVTKPSTPMQALVLKLKRMARSRSQGGSGCPASIRPFLDSLVKGKMKVWDGEGKRVRYRERRGCYETCKGEAQTYYKNNGHGRDGEGGHFYKEGLTVGHFREDWKGWELDAIDLQIVREFFGYRMTIEEQLHYTIMNLKKVKKAK